MTDFKIGDPVKVNDPGLAMLERFRPAGAKPNNHGWIAEIYDTGEYLIEFPIGDDHPDTHSQVAPYPARMLSRRKGPRRDEL